MNRTVSRARRRRQAAVILMITLLTPSALLGQGCGSSGKFVAQIWDEYLSKAREVGCMAPIVGPTKFIACAVNLPASALRLGDKMIAWWNAMASGGWATIGPRRLAPTWQEGTLWGTSGRLFLGTAPVHSETTVSFQKIDGSVPAEVVVCAFSEDGSARRLASHRFDGGQDGTGDLLEYTFPMTADLISVKVDAKGVNPLNKFKYRVKATTEPVKADMTPVRGFADLHLHQAAELGFGGNQFFGSHTGPPREVLWDDGKVGVERVLQGPVAWVDGLHSFPFMGSRHGQGYPTFKDWPHFDDVTHQQVHEDWLKAAHDGGLNLVVVSAVNFEPACQILKVLYPRAGDRMGCRDMENVVRQLEAFIAMDEKHDWYEIAVHPWHARKIINEGKLAVVVSMEVSHLFPRDEGDFITQLERLWGMGMRSLQLAHETDSRFAGAAPHRTLFEIMNYVKWLPQTGALVPIDSDGTISGFQRDEDGRNVIGLSPAGVELVERMIDRRMMIDVAHLSERAMKDLHQLVATKHDYYPLYNSHTRFKPLLTGEDLKIQKEFLSTEEQVRYIHETGGMVGLRTGQNAILTAVEGAEGVANDCDGSSKSFAQLVVYGKGRGIPMGFGTDFNGFINQLGPRFGPERCPKAGDDGAKANQSGTPRAECKLPPDAKAGPRGRDFDTEGLKHIGYLPDLVSDLDALNVPGTAILKSSAEAFLQMWERAYDPKRSKVGANVDLAAEIASTVGNWTPCELYGGPTAVIAGLEGDWVRVVSNYNPNDRMRITVGQGQAILTVVPPSVAEGFAVGQAIWTDIASDGSLKVLGNNGQYYPATVTLEGPDRVQIDVDHTGPGHDQTWERAGPDIEGDWVLLSGGGEGNQGLRVRVEGVRAVLRYLPQAASRGFRAGDVLWRNIGRGDSAGLGRLEAQAADRAWQEARFTLTGEGALELVLAADGSVQRWGRPQTAGATPPADRLRGVAVAGLPARPGLAANLPRSFDALVEEAAVELPAVVTGIVFRDLDSNGVYDEREPGVPGATVRVVDSTGKATLVTTGANGTYRFESSVGGELRLSLDLEPRLAVVVSTYPKVHELTVDRGFTTPAINFGVRTP